MVRRARSYTYVITLRLSARQKAALECMSRRMQIPVSELVRRMIDSAIGGHECGEERGTP
jgi:hypothetical protein